MKKFNLLLLAFISLFVLLGHKLHAQVIFQDDFESHVTDSILEPQSPLWNGWGNVVTSAMVSTDSAYSGSSSMKIWDGMPNGASTALSDVILDFGDSTRGRYLFTFKVLVPSNDGFNGQAGTYWNFQHEIDSTNTGLEWAHEVYLGPDRANSTYQAGGVTYQIPFVADEWVDVHYVIDLDRDMQDFFYDGVWVASHPFTYQTFSTIGQNVLAGADFFAACANACTELGYYDDFLFKHFDDQYNDAGIIEAYIPSYCLGDSADISIELKNWGFNVIGSADINWSIDGVLQAPFSFTGAIAPGASDSIYLGKHMFAGTPPYDLKFWAANPNNQTDTVEFNDTLKMQVGGPALGGTYTVDPGQAASTTNFTSIQSMVTALNLSGICSPTTVNIAPGVYNAALNLSNIIGLSATNTLTIDGGDSSQTIITQNGSYAFATLTFDNVDYVTVRNLTVEHTGTSGDAILFYEADYNEVSNCVSRVDVNSTSSAIYNISFSGSPTANFTVANTHYNTVQNTRIVGGYYGIRMYGSSAQLTRGNRILNNEMDSVYYYGMYNYYIDSVDIIGNNIDMTNRSNQYADGLYIYYSNNIEVSANNIYAEDYGFYWYNYNTYATHQRRNAIVNNMITSVNSDPVYLGYVDSLDIFYNTFSANDASEPALYITGGTAVPIGGYDMRNNIFNSEAYYALMMYEPDSIFIKMDYNLYNSTNYSSLLYIDGTTYADLLAYQTANSALNSNSVEGDPGFYSPTDLHSFSSLVNDAGDAAVPTINNPITVDIDGDLRPSPNGLSVDIGADEFDPPTCPPVDSVFIADVGINLATIYFSPLVVGNVVEAQLVDCGSPIGGGAIFTTSGDSVIANGLTAAKCYDVYIREACSRGDTSFWRGPYSFSTLFDTTRGVNCISNNAITIFTEEFDEPVLNGWTGNINNGTNIAYWNVYNFGTPTGTTGPSGPHSGSNYIYVETSGSYGVRTAMVSPMIDLTKVTDSAELSFWVHAYGSTLGELEVSYSTSPNGPFTELNGWKGEFGQIQSSATEPYYNVGIRLDSLVGQRIYIEFAYTIGTSLYGDLAIDLVEVNACGTCTTPDSLRNTNATLTTVDLAWRENGTATEWEIAYGAPSFDLSQGNRQVVTTNPYTLSGLTQGTDYEYYVRSICGSGDTSGWYGPIKFRTTYGLPYLESFDTFGPNITGNPWPRGWSSSTTTDPLWRTNSGMTQYGNWGTGPLNDHTQGTPLGIYTYMTMWGLTGATADLVTPQVYIDKPAVKLSYWYFFYGSTIDRMEVIVDTNGVETVVQTIIGQQQTAQTDPWYKDSILLVGFSGKQLTVKFRGYNGGLLTGNIALDDVAIDTVEGTDIGVSQILAPQGGVCGLGIDTVKVRVLNMGTQSVSNFDVSYALNGGTPVTETVSATLNAGGFYDHTFQTLANFSASGYYDLAAYTSAVSADSNALNDTTEEEVVNIPVISSYPHTEDFESNAGGWTTGGSSVSWEYGTPQGMIINSASSGTKAWMTNLTTYYNNNEESYVLSPCYDFTNLVLPEIHMDIWYASEGNYDGAALQASKDGGVTWFQIGNYLDPNNWYNVSPIWGMGTLQPSQEGWAGSSGTWVTASHALDSLGGEPNVRLRIVFESDGSVNSYDGFAFDDITIMDAPSDDIGVSAIVSPTDRCYSATSDSVRVEVKNYGTSPTSGATVSYSINNGAITTDSLPVINPLETYVHTFSTLGAIPAAGQLSSIDAWTNYSTDADNSNDSIIGFRFNNLANNSVSVPDTMDFENVPTGSTGPTFANNWFETNVGNGFAWQSNAGATGSTGTGPDVDNTTRTSTGIYMYTEASSGLVGDVATLTSTCYDLSSVSTVLTLEYWYHMYGSNIDVMYVDVDSAGFWVTVDSLVGQQQTANADTFRVRKVNLNHLATSTIDYTSVRFRVISGGTYEGDVAIDDVSMTDNVIIGLNNTASLSKADFGIYPNPSNGLFKLQMNVEGSQKFQLKLQDIQGREIYREELNVNESIIKDYDFANLAKGVYFLNIQSGEESKTEKLIIK